MEGWFEASLNPGESSMRIALTLITALTGLTIVLPDLADAQTATPLNWYRLVSSDNGHTAYLSTARGIDTDTPGQKVAIFMTTKVGPSAVKGVFGEFDSVRFNCDEATMGAFSYIQYSRTGEATDAASIDLGDVKFQPVDMGGQFGLAFKVVCQGVDPSFLPTTGNVTTSELIAADIAAYDRKTGQTFAY